MKIGTTFRAIAFGAAATCLGALSANAATLSMSYAFEAICPNPDNQTRTIELGSDDAMLSCFYSSPNINGINENNDPVFLALISGYDLLDKTDDGSTGTDEGILDDLALLNTFTSGIFTIDLSGYQSFLLLLKFGNNLDPDWAVFEITNFINGDNIFEFATEPDQGGALSHGNAYGVIPLPAAGLLLLTAFGGLGFAARRRRKT